VTKTILTVDDSRTMRDMLMLALKDAGYRVVQAEDGVHGLEVLRAENPDIVITESDAAKKQRAREAGATGWIVKPFDPAKLVDAVRRVAA